MRPVIAFASIPHTGTELVLQAIERAGWRRMGLNGAVNPGVRNVRFGHLDGAAKKHVRVYELARNIPVVVPIRHPIRHEASCRRRSVPEDTLRGYRLAWWFVLEVLCRMPNVRYVPVDAAPRVRDAALDRVSAAIGADVEIDWRKAVNTNPTGEAVMLTPLEELKFSPEAATISRNPLIRAIYG